MYLQNFLNFSSPMAFQSFHAIYLPTYFNLFHFYFQSEDGKVVYKCKLCPKSRKYTDLVDLLEHIPAVHEGKKKYSCKFCQKSFTLLASKRNHEKNAEETGICPQSPSGSGLANTRKIKVCNNSDVGLRETLQCTEVHFASFLSG